ncbi:MAG: biotin--[acetyl-CoA-carboxylase] ligase [Jatrophihabitantaceae bacterium]
MTEHQRLPIASGELADLLTGWQLSTVPETGSTNADLLAAAAAGALDRTLLVAEHQRGGRGRLDRSWSSPAGAGLTFSMLLRPSVPMWHWGWLPLLAGLALCRTIGADATLKWPNDLLLGPDGGKVAGILAQSADGAVVIGVGLNVSTTAAELPVDTATSLAIQGSGQLDRVALLAGFVTEFDRVLAAWQAADGDAERSGLAADYRQHCATIGRQVQLEMPVSTVLGEAIAVDSSGRLVVRPAAGSPTLTVAAGDVTHVRPISR